MSQSCADPFSGSEINGPRKNGCPNRVLPKRKPETGRVSAQSIGASRFGFDEKLAEEIKDARGMNPTSRRARWAFGRRDTQREARTLNGPNSRVNKGAREDGNKREQEQNRRQ